jgi:hypothetical protein
MDDIATTDPRGTTRTLDPETIGREMDDAGCAILPGLLDGAACTSIAGLYEQDEPFRSRVVMARHGYGSGEYKYFADPLPPLVQGLRERVYASLVPVANGWNRRLGRPTVFPAAHRDYRALCHAAGQTRPTPLLLRYGAGDYNCLHQDVYGELLFPIQLAILLSRPGDDFEGGEFVLVEQRPRMQSRALVVPLRQGDGVLFPVRERPARGSRGDHRVVMRHGVSRLRAGERYTLGIIFHDAT